MASHAPRTTTPASLDGHAADTLKFIRSTMERSTTFTAVPGAGSVVMGGVALVAAAVAAGQPTGDRWLLCWLVAAAIAAAAGLGAMARKSRQVGSTLTSGNARRFAVAVSAPIVAGAALTYALWSTHTYAVLPASWLLLYGAGVLTGGAFSVPVVRVVGLAFMGLGIVAVLTPVAWGNVWLAVGFGGLHIGSGLYITRHHGG